MILVYMLILSSVLFLILMTKYINPSHPIFMYVGLMTFTIFGYTVMDFPELQTDTIVIYFTTILSFILGYFSFLIVINKIKIKKRYNEELIYKIEFSNKFYFFIVFLYIISIVGIGLQGLENASSENTGNFFLNLRVAHINDPAKFGFYPHIVLFLQSFLLLLYFTSKKNIKIILVLFLFISIYGSFWKMERTGMMMSIIAMILSVLVKNNLILMKKINYFKILVVVFSIIGLFLIITISRSNVGIDHAIESLAEYMFKSIYTFDKYVLPYEGYGDYKYYFGAVGEKIISMIYPSNKLDIYVEDLFNVYSYLVGPYIFGGRYLLYITFYFIGMFYAFLYYKVLQRNIYFMGTNLQMGFFPYVVYNFLKLLIGSPRNHF